LWTRPQFKNYTKLFGNTKINETNGGFGASFIDKTMIETGDDTFILTVVFADLNIILNVTRYINFDRLSNLFGVMLSAE
jgi:hypothetical protein